MLFNYHRIYTLVSLSVVPVLKQITNYGPQTFATLYIFPMKIGLNFTE